MRRNIEADLERIRCGPMAVLHAVIDHVVDDYVPVIDGLDNDMAGDRGRGVRADRARGSTPAERIFKLKREVLDFHRNTEPLLEPLAVWRRASCPALTPSCASYFRDVEDHLQRVVSAIEPLPRPAVGRPRRQPRAGHACARTTTCARSRRGSPSAAVPTVIGAIYGMNFEHMPELGNRFGYPSVLLIMALSCFYLYRRFKRIGWL